MVTCRRRSVDERCRSPSRDVARMGGGLVTGPRFVRYQADIWAEVSHDGEIVTVVVDTASMAHPIDVLGDDGEPAEGPERADAIEAAQSQEWPSWGCGAHPVADRTQDL